jgi:ferredoxin-NADP reductase
MASNEESRRVHVSSIREVATDTLCFDLAPADGRPLPPFAAGAHVDVHTPSGQVRQYSLCGDPTAQGTDYRIAVKRESSGRGGSLGMHQQVSVGTPLGITGPRNHFPLEPDAKVHLLLAGGIGVTPLYAMAQALARRGEAWKFHYCARSREHAAFYDEIVALGGKNVLAHFGPTPILDTSRLLREQPPGTHVYCCGPRGLMEAVEAATAHWSPGNAHFEWFAGVDSGLANVPFEVELARRRVTYLVPAEKTILQVLRENDVFVDSSCEQGVCGTCETTVLSGEVEHRDLLLSPEERSAGRTMMICVSRARSPKIVLDL